ncbi:hypothetical protein VE02_02084 [Pseudogymnoascus sp. 03VT05]|nr:hypothetical protein VE02_02084 [Pseudogymnoascus sp. 03VT05]
MPSKRLSPFPSFPKLHASMPSTQLSSFPSFLKLPIEIQIMIWQHAIHSIPGRGILLRYGPNRLSSEVLNHTRIPAGVLHACYLTRLLAQERWTLGIPNDASSDKKVYIDVKRDAIFYLGPP